jgi:uncharacterized protein (DUF1800 family)
MSDPIASRAHVARLFGRAAFGATAADLDGWAGKPYAAAVDQLLAVPDPTIRPVQVDEVNFLLAQNGANAQVAQQWWLARMKTTPYPLEERMTLFWHDHWATSVHPEGPTIEYVMRQNQTLRKYSLGNFRAMCQAMTIDGAMLQWLDGDVSTVNNPNENYAREFLELFTLGTFPQVYTEHDIREAARVLTGWVVDPGTGQARFVTGQHDKGDKVVLGTTIHNQEAEEYKTLIDVVLAQSVAAKFVAYKMVQSLAYAPSTLNLLTHPDPLIDDVAAALVKNNWEIKPALRRLLVNDRFRFPDAPAGKQSVRQPVELAVHAAKIVNASFNDNSYVPPLARAGQQLFYPPNVGGWPVGKGWISTTTTLARYDLAYTFAIVRQNAGPLLRAPLPPSTDIEAGGGQWTAAMGLGYLRPTTLAALKSYVRSRRTQPDATEDELQSGVFILLATSPDWEVM